MVCLAPRALGDSVRPRRLSGAVVRPLNFTVRGRSKNPPEGEIRIRRAKAKTLRLTLPFVRARAAREASRQGRRRWLRFVAAVPPLDDRRSLRRSVSVCAEDAARAQ